MVEEYFLRKQESRSEFEIEHHMHISVLWQLLDVKEMPKENWMNTCTNRWPWFCTDGVHMGDAPLQATPCMPWHAVHIIYHVSIHIRYRQTLYLIHLNEIPSPPTENKPRTRWTLGVLCSPWPRSFSFVNQLPGLGSFDWSTSLGSFSDNSNNPSIIIK